MSLTVHDIYLDVRRALKRAAVSMPELEARELTAYACGADKRRPADWISRYAAQEEADRARALAERRQAGEPLAYLLGEWDFCGLTFRVTPDVLIPRADTERMCELAAQRARDWDAPRVLDLCCGSGCIGIALLAQAPAARCVSVDLSEAALAVARDNAHRHGLSGRCICVRGDALAPPPGQLRGFHIMVCNPPYITADEMAALDRSVSGFEPHMALFGGQDGLDFYRAIAAQWMPVLAPGGTAFFECGWKQARAVAAILAGAGWQGVRLETDYAGVRRIVIASSPEQPEQVFGDGLQNAQA